MSLNSFTNNKNKVVGIDSKNLNKEICDNLESLKKLSAREYLLYQKFLELEGLKTKITITQKFLLQTYKKRLMDKNDLKVFMESDQNDVEIVICDTPELKDIWVAGRMFISILPWKQNPGRNMKVLIMINKKIAGFVALASDVMLIKVRDDYIGWTKQNKLDEHLLNYSSIGSVIIPVQPLGNFALGGKLLSLLMYHTKFRESWESLYPEKLVGITTTSLFGINSQYLGMKKYWKVLGETTGQMPLYPDDSFHKKMISWLRVNHKDEYADAMDSESGMVTCRKMKTTEFYYKKTKLKEDWKNRGKTSKDLKHEFKRGVFYAKLYENSLEFFRGEIKESELKPRTTLNFDINSVDSIVEYWKKKFANRRYEKMKNNKDDEVLFINTFKDFKTFHSKYTREEK